MGRRCVEDREINRLSLICRRAPQARGWIGALRRGCDQQEQADGRHPRSGDVSNSAPGDLLSECVKGVLITEICRGQPLRSLYVAQVVQDGTIPVPGFEHHALECLECGT